MTSLFGARRRAEEFAAAVDGSPGDAGRPFDEADLVAVATLLREHPVVSPREEFVTELRTLLMAEAETALSPENAALALPVRQHGARERRLVAAASAAILLGGTASMAAAAQSALPGEPLYPIKRGIEQVEAGLSLSDAAQGRDLLSQANARLDEVDGLLAADSATDAARVPQTLDAFTSQAHQGATLLLDAFQETRDPEAVVSVRKFAASGITALEELAPTVPADAQDELSEAAVTLRTLDQQASTLCSTCASDLPELQVPGIFLARAEVDRALQTVSDRQLDNSHPVAVHERTLQEAGDAAAKVAADAEANVPSGQAEEGATPDGTSAPDGIDVTTDREVRSPKSLLPEGWPTAPTAETAEKFDDVAELPGKVVEDLTAGLDDAVKTLLPEPDGSSGLLP